MHVQTCLPQQDLYRPSTSPSLVLSAFWVIVPSDPLNAAKRRLRTVFHSELSRSNEQVAHGTLQHQLNASKGRLRTVVHSELFRSNEQFAQGMLLLQRADSLVLQDRESGITDGHRFLSSAGPRHNNDHHIGDKNSLARRDIAHSALRNLWAKAGAYQTMLKTNVIPQRVTFKVTMSQPQ